MQEGRFAYVSDKTKQGGVNDHSVAVAGCIYHGCEAGGGLGGLLTMEEGEGGRVLRVLGQHVQGSGSAVPQERRVSQMCLHPIFQDLSTKGSGVIDGF